MRQRLETLPTMSTRMKVRLTECVWPFIALIQSGSYSGASKHITENVREFDSYSPYSPTDIGTIQTADGTTQTIKGVALV